MDTISLERYKKRVFKTSVLTWIYGNTVEPPAITLYVKIMVSLFGNNEATERSEPMMNSKNDSDARTVRWRPFIWQSRGAAVLELGCILMEVSNTVVAFYSLQTIETTHLRYRGKTTVELTTEHFQSKLLKFWNQLFS